LLSLGQIKIATTVLVGAVGDNVLLLNEEDADAPFVCASIPFFPSEGHCRWTGHFQNGEMPVQICKIEKVVVKGKDAAMQVKWFYRPEETCSGRRVNADIQKLVA